ncbi:MULTISPECIES: hypothetical protein [unclassified Streptomyces]|uniref:hypothetical protein n=1 Tax=unclassified Streptomyces TaxID=2593676 RepID=UPI002E804BB6|nr:hypothetical protein [Streptomyces sp. NBC_00562]WTD34483.1 hypothetical protein OHB03_20895 [Streptomyces sp. NBC_01643]WUC20935.1 hypothetical protein OHA33_19845 [Streptomyces sp. NBC_00562]
MTESVETVRHLSILADHGQFYLQDLQRHGVWIKEHGADPALPPAGWTEEASQHHRIGVEPHSISVGTARDDLVDVTLHLRAAAPPLRMDEADHIVEADADYSSGDLAVYGPADAPGEEFHLPTPAGRYRIRVSYMPVESLDHGSAADGFGDRLLYYVDMWPTAQPSGLLVLKQGPSPWAG